MEVRATSIFSYRWAYSVLILFTGHPVLAAWMRLKYPHIAVGALASSAPILQFENIVPDTIFYDLVSNDFKVRVRIILACFYCSE